MKPLLLGALPCYFSSKNSEILHPEKNNGINNVRRGLHPILVFVIIIYAVKV